MSDTSTQHAAPRNVPALLLGLRQQRFSGAVVVAGSPGGTIHLSEGLVNAIETAAAPTPESALLKSRRISEADWTAARVASLNDGRLGAALVARGLLGAAELDVVSSAAVFDGAFAMALSPAASWEVSDGVPAPVLPADPGVEPQWLADETTRRMALLSQRWGSPARLAGSRPHASSRAPSSSAPLSPRDHELLLSANGRRTPRDIAFALGRGVFPVMLDLIRLEARQFLVQDVPSTTGPAPSAAPRTAGAGAPPTGAPEPLPRRRPVGQRPAEAGEVADGPI